MFLVVSRIEKQNSKLESGNYIGCAAVTNVYLLWQCLETGNIFTHEFCQIIIITTIFTTTTTITTTTTTNTTTTTTTTATNCI